MHKMDEGVTPYREGDRGGRERLRGEIELRKGNREMERGEKERKMYTLTQPHVFPSCNRPIFYVRVCM